MSYMPSEKFPVCVLFLSLNPSRVDVNVHPAKLEVKFSNEKPVFEAVYYAVKQALEQNTARPEMNAQNGYRMSQAFAPVEREASLKARQISIDVPQERAPLHEITEKRVPPTEKSRVTADEYRAMVGIPPRADDQRAASRVEPVTDEKNEAQTEKKYQYQLITAEQYVKEYLSRSNAEELRDEGFCDPEQTVVPEKSAEDVKTEQKQEKAAPAPDTSETVIKPYYRIVGEVFNSYILVELAEKMLIIDKHAAHERIIFEQLKRNMYAKDTSSQMLMLPIDIMLMSDEVAAIEEYRGELEAVGFDFTSSRNTVSVNAIPLGIEQDAVADMIMTVADRIKNGTGSVNITKNIVFEKALYQASCKAAIKAGREYPPEYQKWVVDKLMELSDITFCPHGRPVAMEMSKKNMDRQFERT